MCSHLSFWWSIVEWWPPKIHGRILISRTCERQLIWKKGIWSCSWDLGMMRSSWISWADLEPVASIFISRAEADWREHRGEDEVKMEVEIGMVWPQAKEGRQCRPPPEARRGKRRFKSLWRRCNTLISDFWPPRLCQHRFLCSVTRSAIICCSSRRKYMGKSLF